MPLSKSLEIRESQSGHKTRTLHTFCRMGDCAYLALFEAFDMPLEFETQHDYHLHIALEVNRDVLAKKFAEGRARGIETRGISDHEFIHSIYFRDPNGYVIELTTKLPGHDMAMDAATNQARARLDRWQLDKAHPARGAS